MARGENTEDASMGSTNHLTQRWSTKSQEQHISFPIENYSVPPQKPHLRVKTQIAFHESHSALWAIL